MTDKELAEEWIEKEYDELRYEKCERKDFVFTYYELKEMGKQAFLAGLKAGKDMNVATKWHDLQENPTDLPQCKEDEQIIFYVKEWYESISKYKNHYCLGFYKKAFLNDDVKLFVEKSKGYENEHLPETVLRWCELL